jgi:ferredoxin
LLPSLLVAWLAISIGSIGPVEAQTVLEVTPELLPGVVPQATRFGPQGGEPLVYEAFGEDPATGVETQIGFAFVTSDLPPEVRGYSAPIAVLVGMDLQGVLTGIQILGYRESLMESRGDFLNSGSYLLQFPGKHVVEPFRVRTDIDGISGATITVDAMSRGIRNAARRVAAAYLNRPPPGAESRYIGTIEPEVLEGLLWAEMVDQELAVQVSVADGPIQMAMSIVYLSSPSVGHMLVGETNFRAARDTLGARGDDYHPMLIGLGGTDPFFFRTSALSFVQDGDTIAVPSDDILMLPLLRDGKLQGEVRRSGVLYVDGSLDLLRPIEIVLDLGPRGERASEFYQVMPPQAAVATQPVPGTGGARVSAASPGALQANSEPPHAGGSGGEQDLPGLAAAPNPQIDYEALLFDAEETEESQLSLVLERTSWPRVGGFLLLLALATGAFVTKRTGLRWVTLGGTFLLLGYVDGGFLSVSHILAGISVGPSVYLSDIPLLLLVGFTVITTLLFGRIFCGFLCPFGALQDLLERVVPRGLRRELPKAVHKRALLIKYVILAIVLTPVLIGIEMSLFQYFEPFGTVFYWSSSWVLWGIAGLILIASAIVPRFYCRYACPLGAALAIGSLVAPFRIGRVEQCKFCKVCEQQCPTGAIDGPSIDFKECVRCNVCEVLLAQKAGVCRHDMERIRPRLATLPITRVGAPNA